MTDEERVRRAFRILFYYQHKMREEIEEIKKRLEELEKRLSNIYRIGDN
jgi:tetrahydromethanopterin S-methyltransferase subunit G